MRVKEDCRERFTEFEICRFTLEFPHTEKNTLFAHKRTQGLVNIYVYHRCTRPVVAINKCRCVY